MSFRHEALFHSGDEGFLAGTVPFLREGLEAGEPMLVAVGPHRRDLLRAALGQPAADRVTWADMRAIGRNPARIIPVWHAFVDRHGGAPIRGIGEPAWAGRSDDELCECHRHEALLNTAFDGGPSWRLLCPYDLDGLPRQHLHEAARTHPVVIEHGLPLPSPAFRRTSAPSPFAGELPAPPDQARAMAIELDGLARARMLVSDHAEDAGLVGERVEDLRLVVTELACNALLHGTGPAELHVWRDRAAVVCQVACGGRLRDPLAGRRLPPDKGVGGWGLYLVNQLCDLVQIRSHDRRTVVRVRMGR